MTKKLANIFSILYHPLLMTSLMIGFLIFYSPELLGQVSGPSRWWLLGTFFVLTFLLPMINIYVLKLTSSISSMQMHNRQERVFPMALTSIYYGVTAYFLLFKFPLGSVILNIIIIGVFITITAITLVTFFWKISAHSAGAWGGVGFFLALFIHNSGGPFLLPLIISILLSGLISSSRLYLNAHSIQQVTAGGLLGFLICFSTFYFFI